MRNATRELVAMLSDMLNGGAGNLNPTKDQMARAWQDRTGLPLLTCIEFIDQRLDLAIAVLDRDEGWSCWAPVTVDFYKLRSEPDGSDWPLLQRCVAGQGRGNATVGIHFHTKLDDDCWLWLIWRDFFEKIGRGVNNADVGNIARVQAAKLQPDPTMERILAARRRARTRETNEIKRITTRLVGDGEARP